MESKDIRVAYIGLHPHSLEWICKKPFKVVAAAKLDFLLRFSVNPANWYSAALYAFAERVPALLRPLYIPSLLILSLSTGVHARYRGYVLAVVRYGVRIIDAENETRLVSRLQELDLDLILINSWSLLPGEVPQAARLGGVNIHPSRLPQYRGALPTLWSLKHRDSSSAVTLVALTSGVDDGWIVAQHDFPISERDSSLDLERKIDLILRDQLHADLLDFVQSGAKRPQEGEPTRTGKYADYATIRWEAETARDIHNKVLLYPYLEPFFYCSASIRGKEVEIRNLSLAKEAISLAPGSFTRKGLSLYAGAVDGSLKMRLFKDLGVADSVWVLLNTRRELSS